VIFLLDPTKLSPEDLERLTRIAGQIVEKKQSGALFRYVPLPRQREFHEAGLDHRLRLFLAANQSGKTYAGAAEMAMHLTGEYPEDWHGYRFDHPIKAWAAGESAQSTRDTIQSLILGPFDNPEAQGTAALPKWSIKGVLPSRGISMAVDTVTVEHRTEGLVDGLSTLSFKSYEQGREKFQGTTLDLWWIDEEPPLDIYQECLMRISATGGIGYITCTPLKGMSEVMRLYLNEQSLDRKVIRMRVREGIQGQLFTEEQIQRKIAEVPSYLRPARFDGIPVHEGGLIFQVNPENLIIPKTFDIPLHFTKMWGMDFGIAHAFAAALIAYDRDTDTVYLIDEIVMRDSTPFHQVPRMLARAGDVMVAYPHDGDTREKSTGVPLVRQYRELGLNTLGSFASHPQYGNSREASIADLANRMLTGRFYIWPHCTNFMREMQLYHRDENGLIVAKDDDLISAVRYAIMCLSKAQPGPLGPSSGRGVTMGRARGSNQGGPVRGTEFPLF
jgi:phage terminase large subunit-like protein